MNLSTNSLFAFFVFFAIFCGNSIAQRYESASGAGTTNAQVIFAADGVHAARVVSVDITSDLAGSVLTFQTGVTSYPITAAATNSTNLVVSGYGTLASNDVVVIQTKAGSLTNGTVYSVANSTNVNFKAAIGVTVAGGDLVYKL